MSGKERTQENAVTHTHTVVHTLGLRHIVYHHAHTAQSISLYLNHEQTHSVYEQRIYFKSTSI